MGLLTETAEPAKEILGGATIDVVADKGYFKIEDIEACEKAGMAPYVPRPQRGPSVRKGLFRKDEFKPGFPRWNGRSGPKAAETLAKPRIPSFTRRVRQDSAI